jgi:type IV pilus assembly protein PilE
MPTAQHKRGFTLIELVVVIATLMIILSLAIPAYGRYSYRARRVEARELLMRVAAAQERFYTNFNRYAADPVTGSSSLGIRDTSEHGYYKVTTENGPSGDSQSYLLKAVPQGAQGSDKCGTMTLNNNGAKAPATSDATANSNGACW